MQRDAIEDVCQRVIGKDHQRRQATQYVYARVASRNETWWRSAMGPYCPHGTFASAKREVSHIVTTCSGGGAVVVFEKIPRWQGRSITGPVPRFAEHVLSSGLSPILPEWRGHIPAPQAGGPTELGAAVHVLKRTWKQGATFIRIVGFRWDEYVATHSSTPVMPRRRRIEAMHPPM
jgi:hypothetical protein